MVKDTVTSEQKNKQDKKKKKRKGKKKKCKHQHYKPPNTSRTSLVVQWLRIRASNTGGTGSIPGRGSSTCCALQPNKPPSTSLRCLPLAMVGMSVRAASRSYTGKIQRIARSPRLSWCVTIPAETTLHGLSHYAYFKWGEEKTNKFRETVVQSIMTAELMKECNHKHLQPRECRTLAQMINKESSKDFFKDCFLFMKVKTSNSSKMISRNLGGNVTHLRKPHKSLSHRYLEVLKAKAF